MKNQIKVYPYIFLCSIWILISQSELSAQSITLTSPLADTTFTEGDDYFKVETNNKFDSKTRSDILQDVHFDEDSISVSNEIWSGVSQFFNASIYLVWQGFAGFSNLGHTGWRYPINTQKYTHIVVAFPFLGKAT